ncbi:putative membrane protein YphA (DoxX/SURF4 family) [Evansella vedderi]|uniref:Membrane protein YphA (DoxX/SURF4 family) n=1 Tax=Evansella vedderi TaxID=38282 RepID=A0ABT9ZR47_9BACI|nr:DoxX family protein [Evansella vedderi]MDQ0253430.1 putative membrane protein YphA (DoxX/SURF4 family) [Evansella vedderi]
MRKVDLGITIVRVIVGLIFFAHGMDKVVRGLGNTMDYFASLGIPGFLAIAVAFIELVGGLALILGLGTRLVATMLIPVMLGAIYFVHWPEGLMRSAAGAGYELNLILLGACLHLALSGSNYFAVDSLLEKTGAEYSTKIGKWIIEKR